MTKLSIILFSFASMCIASSADSINSSAQEDTIFTPYNESDHTIRIITGRGYKLNDTNLNFFEVSYFGRFYTQYDYSFLSSIGFMQEYGYAYRSWSDDELDDYIIYGIIGAEVSIFNNLYFDLYFGLYPVYLPTPTSGIRSRYTISLHQYIKLDVGGSLDFTKNLKIYRLYVGFVLF